MTMQTIDIDDATWISGDDTYWRVYRAGPYGPVCLSIHAGLDAAMEAARRPMDSATASIYRDTVRESNDRCLAVNGDGAGRYQFRAK